MQATIYQHGNYAGKSQNLSVGRYEMNQLTIGNDTLSSLKVPFGLQVTLYSNSGFQGKSKVYKKGTSFTKDFNDTTSSIVVEYRDDVAIIFEAAGFKGNAQALKIGRYEMKQLTIKNDSLSSVKVPSGLKVTLYEHNFTGKSRTYTKDISFTKDFNDTTSSVVVESAQVQLDSNAYYKMVIESTGKVVDVAAGSKSNGGNIHQWDYHGGDNQLWKFEPIEGGYYKITVKHSGLVVDVHAGSKENGANIYQWTWHGGQNQHWKVEALEDGTYRIISRNSGKVFDVSGHSTANGGNIHQWAWHGGKNQRIRLEKISINKPILKFDGQNDMVAAQVNASETAHTATIWFKTGNGNCGIFSVDAGEKGAKGHDRHIYLKDGNLCARVWSNEIIQTSGTNYADNQWHCVTHVFGGGIGGQRLYVDGVSKAKGNKAKSDFHWQDGINLGYCNDAKQPFFEGEIASVSVWNIARDERDIQQYKETLTGNESGLLLYWNFENGKGTTVTDRSKNKLNGTTTGSPQWGKSVDFGGGYIPTIIPEETDKIRKEGEKLAKAGTTLGKGYKRYPPKDLPKKPLSALIQSGAMPQYGLLQRLLAAIVDDKLKLDEKLLGEFGKIGGLIAPIVNVFVTIDRPKVEFVQGKPGMIGAPGMEVKDPDKVGNLATPEDHSVKVTGGATLFGLKTTVEAEFFHYKKKQHTSLKFLLPDPIGIGRFLPDVPVIGGLTLAGPTIIACTANTLYDPNLDSGINEGFNFFGNFKFAESTSKEIRFVGDLLKVKEVALHAAIDTSKPYKQYVFEMAIQRDVTIVDGSNFKLRFTRSDFGITVKGTPPEPAFAVSNDLVVSLKENGKDTHLVFTGGLKIEPESITGSFTMNGTGRSHEGKLSGNIQNTGEWKEPFGIPGVVIRQMAAQLGCTYAAPWIDNIGVHGNLKIGDVDGSISVLVDANDADQFVLAGSTDKITVIQMMSAMSPATFIAYQAIPLNVRETMNNAVDVSMENVKVNIVPTACSIGGVHFRDEGVTLMGTLNCWGWKCSAFVNVDTRDGITARADMDPVNILNVFKISGAQGGRSPLMRLRVSPRASENELFISGKVQLLGLSSELRLQAKKDYLEFMFKNSISNILTTSLTCSYHDYNLRAKGSINFNLNLDAPTPFGNVKLVDIGFNAASELRVGIKDGFYLQISGNFRFYGSSITFPTLTLNIAPSDFRAVFNAVVKKIKDEAGKLFLSVFGTLGEWANAVKNGVIKFAGVVADVAKNVYRAGEQAAIQAYKTLNKGVTEVARGLRNVYGKSKEQAARLLKGAGYAAEEVGRALKDAYHTSLEAAGQALKYAGYAAHEVGRTMKNVYGASAQVAARGLKYAGYAVNEVGSGLKSAYGATERTAATALRYAGYGVNEVGSGLRSAYGATERTAASALKYAGYGANEVGRGIKSAYGATARTTAVALKYAGYGVNEVGHGVKSAYGATAGVATDALRYAGYGVNEVGNFAKGAYNLGNDAVNGVLKGAGYAASQVDKGFKKAGEAIVDAGKKVVDTFNPTKW